MEAAFNLYTGFQVAVAPDRIGILAMIRMRIQQYAYPSACEIRRERTPAISGANDRN